MRSLHDLLSELAHNLWWTWNPEFDSLFREIDIGLWRRVNHTPTAFLREVSQDSLDAAAQDPSFRMRVESAIRRLGDYVHQERHWGNYNTPAFAARPIAYFCAEFGLHESLPIYSGGLGVLAGDHLKSASDLGIPMWGVSILYRDGYFTQHIAADGSQEESYISSELEGIAVTPIPDADGNQMEISIPCNAADTIYIRLWKATVGRTHLLLLDGHREDGKSESFNRRLYGGDHHSRILQEMMLGIGGFKALRAIGVRPGVIHLNEGHSAFAILEAIAERMEEEGLAFSEAAHRVRARVVFTTHTPVEAGHDRFAPPLLWDYMESYATRLGLKKQEFLGLGRVRPKNNNETFCMTVLALKHASRSNAVSALHAHKTQQMWHELWPDREIADTPIGHITNGVHVPSWIAPPVAEYFTHLLGYNWRDRLCHADLWQGIYAARPSDIWEIQMLLKAKLTAFVNRRTAERWARLGLAGDPPHLDPEVLTIGFARRFAAYKRAGMLFSDMDRLVRVCADAERPVQIIYAGKAHPNDDLGKGLLREVCAHAADPRLKGRIVFVENYDLNVGRHLVQGCDLWLNTPRRPLEACGTSGQKAIFNFTLNCSILDGWWAEAYSGANGFAVGHGQTHTDMAVQDARDTEDLYAVLENEIVPEFYDRAPDGIPHRWIHRVQHALASLAWRYNSDRMVMDYARLCYLDAAGARTASVPEYL